jgi:DNA-binding CsgD family transcriptional regulator
MLDLPELSSAALDARPAAGHAHAPRHYAGPERRSGGLLEQHRLTQMLDEIDYGMLLLDAEAQLLHVNKAARRDLDAQHPLQLLGSELRTRHSHDVAPLRDAIGGAAHRGLRRLLSLGDGAGRVSVAVVPMSAQGADGRGAALLVLGKRQVCEELTVDWYARSRGLTLAETAVIKGLCADLTPEEIARRQGVGLATIRTQIGSIRTKTDTASIKALVREVAMLPPLMSALQGLGPLLDAGLGSAARRGEVPGANRLRAGSAEGRTLRC